MVKLKKTKFNTKTARLSAKPKTARLKAGYKSAKLSSPGIKLKGKGNAMKLGFQRKKKR